MNLPSTYRFSVRPIRLMLTVVAVAAAGTGLIEIGQAFRLALGGEADPALGASIGGCGLLLIAVLCVKTSNVRLDVDQRGIRVVNLFHSEMVPWDRIRRFLVGGTLIIVQLDDGKVLPILAVQRTNPGRRFRLADELNAVVAERRSSTRSPP
jgi:hypothetical protein